MIRAPIRNRIKYAFAVASIVAVVGAYAVLCANHKEKARAKGIDDTTIPNWEQFQQGWKSMNTREIDGSIMLRDDMKATAKRYVWGIAIGFTLALFFGLMMGCSNHVDAFFSWPIAFFAAVPATAMLSVYMVMFQDMETRLVAIVSLGIFPNLAKAISLAAQKDVPEHAVYKAYTLGASHFEVIHYVVFRQIFPRIIDALRLSLGPGIVFLIAAEALFCDVGFGYRLRIQSRNLNINIVFIYLAMLGLSFILADLSLRLFRRWRCPWFGD